MTDKEITINQMLEDWKSRSEETDLHLKPTRDALIYEDKLELLQEQGLKWSLNIKPVAYQRSDWTTYYTMRVTK